MKEKVPSLELCQQMFKLKITKKGSTEKIWREDIDLVWYITRNISPNLPGIPAPDLHELGKLLSKTYSSGVTLFKRNKSLPNFAWREGIGKLEAETEEDARTLLLIKIAEKAKEKNEFGTRD